MHAEPERGGADVRLDLLGRARIVTGAGTVELGDGLPQRLLVVLALRRRWVGRDDLGALLWPEYDPERRRTNLRRVLARARAWPWTRGIVADRDGLRWLVATDVERMADATVSTEDRLRLYRGPIFEDASVLGDEDDAFGAWLEDERRRAEAAHRTLVLEHATQSVERGHADAAVTVLTLLVERDPLDEEAVQRLMTAWVSAGRPERARATYRAFAAALERELGLAPLDATRALIAGLGAGRVVVEPAPGDAQARATHATTPFVGRDDAVLRVRASGRGWTLVTGEAGIGKTRLVAKALAGVPTLWIRGGDGLEAPPFSAVADALRSVLTAPVARDRLAAVPVTVRTAIDRLVPGALATTPSAPSGDLSAARAHLADAVAEAIATVADTVVVDDAFGLDAGSAEVVTRVLARHRRGGPRVVATARPLDEGARGPLLSALEAWRADGRVEVVTIGPLAMSEALALFQAIAPALAEAGLAERVLEVTGGHPLYVLETARHLAEHLGAPPMQRDARVAASDQAALPLPPDLLETIVARVERLGAATRRVLEAASLAVSPFTLAHVAPATALAPWLALEGLERAVAAGLLTGDADGGYCFAHGLVRTAVAGAMASERRSLVEQRLAWALERERGAPALVAAHYERAGRRDAAVRWHRRAADEAEALFMPAVALEHLTRALDLADGPALVAELHLRRAGVFDRLGDVRGCQDALDAAEHAAREAGDRGLRVRVALARGEDALGRHDSDEVRAAVAIAFGLGAAGADAARAHFLVGAVARLEGELSAAHDAFVAALDAAPRERSELIGRIHLDGLCRLTQVAGDLPTAIEHARAARSAFGVSAARARQAEADIVLGMLLYHQGAQDVDAAIEALGAGLEAARDAADVPLQRKAILNLLKLHTDRCDLPSALPLLEEGFAIAHDFDDVDAETAFLLASGWVRYLQGELGAAWSLFDRAATVADAGRNAAFRAFARSVPFNARLMAGDVAVCEALLGTLTTIVEEGDLGFMQPRVALLCARLDVARGAAGRALRALRPVAARDDLEAEDAGEVRLAIGLALEALGRPAEAAEIAAACLEAPTLEVVQAAEALRLRVMVAMRAPFAEAEAAVRARLASGRTLPFEAIELMLALADAEAAAGDERAAEARRADAAHALERLRASVAKSERSLEAVDAPVG